nr:MAG TPA: hypothetical protein [Caudoviricetes sp.]
MVPEFRPERHLFPQCEAVLGFTQTCQKRSVPMSFRDRGHAQLHPLVAGFRPPRPRLSGVPAWEKGEYPGDRNRTGLQLERVQSNAPAGGLQTASRPRWDDALFATRLRGAALRIQLGGSRTSSHATLCRHPRSPGSTPRLCGLVPGRRRGSPLLQIPLAYPHRSRQKLRRQRRHRSQRHRFAETSRLYPEALPLQLKYQPVVPKLLRVQRRPNKLGSLSPFAHRLGQSHSQSQEPPPMLV